MEIVLAIAAVTIVLFLMMRYKGKKEEQESNDAADKIMQDVNVQAQEEKGYIMEPKSINMNIGTRDLFLQTLVRIGCQYEIVGDDADKGDISFGYQGENFIARTNNNFRYLHLYDTYWGRIDMYDIDEFSRLRKAVNESNLNNSVTAVYTIDKESSTVNVHSKSVILFIPQIPDIENYLRLELNEFFRVHNAMNSEMNKLRETEKKNS